MVWPIKLIDMIYNGEIEGAIFKKAGKPLSLFRVRSAHF